MNRYIRSPFRIALGYLPTLAVLSGLGFLAYEGHRRGWQWGEKPETKTSTKAPDDDDADKSPTIVADGKDEYSSFDSTLPITHSRAGCKLDRKDLKFANAEVVRNSGIRIGIVKERELEAILNVTGTVEFDPTKIARVSARTGGFLTKINFEVGNDIEPRDCLAIVDSAEVGKVKAAFYQAKVQLDLKQQLRERLQSGISKESTIIEADAAVRETRVSLATAHQAILNLGLKFNLADAEKKSDTQLARDLQFLGLPRNIVNGMPDESTSNLLPIFNPLETSGVVLQRDCVNGETVAPLQTIFVVGDPRRMVLVLDVRQEDAHSVALGQSVSFRPDGENSQRKPVAGKINSIGREIDPKTRTVKVRAFVDNSDGRLKAKSFGAASITIQEKNSVLTVPEEAIQWEGCSHIVFLKEEPDQFEVRFVKLGIRRGGFVEVKSGVKAGDEIAVQGSHVLKSYLFKDRIGSAEE